MFRMRKRRVLLWSFTILAAYLWGYSDYIGKMWLLGENTEIMKNFEEITGNNKYEALCYQQVYEGKLTDNQQYVLAKQIIEKMSGEVVNSYEFETSPNKEDNKMTVYGYTDKLDDYIEVMGERVNLNIVFSYNDNENLTNIYLASPLLNYDF